MSLRGPSRRGGPSAIAPAVAAYDSLATRFDDLWSGNPLLEYSARVSEELLESSMAGRSRLLELGCGTGRETLRLAAMGKEVVACDVSKASLEVLERKAHERNLQSRIETHELPASKLSSLESEFPVGTFDGAYSSFALHYERNLEEVPAPLSRLLKPRAPFLCSLYNRQCLMEWLLMAPFLIPEKALRRLEGRMNVTIEDVEATLWSRSPSEVARIFAPRFALVQNWAIPAVLPPPYLQSLVVRAGGARKDWEALDRRVNGVWPFRNLGSATAFLFRRTQEHP